MEVVYRAKHGYFAGIDMKGGNQYRENPVDIESKGKLRAETTPL